VIVVVVPAALSAIEPEVADVSAAAPKLNV
jgi:hypothetical protein